MNDDNVYETPSSDVLREAENQSGFIYTGPKSTEIGNGVGWIAKGWNMFKQDPGQWILTIVVFFVISIILSLIPILGQIASALLTYVWVGGFMLGCQAARDGQGFKVEYLFAGFSNRVGALIGLSVLVFIIAVAIMLLAMGSVYLDILAGNELNQEDLSMTGFFLPMLIGFAILLPLMMAVWFAPALLVLQKMSILAAMKASFSGCLKNILPFLIFGVLMLVLLFIAAIPLALGLLIVVPIAICATYAGYEDIFLSKGEEPLSESL